VSARRKGFSLVEMLIVVVVLGIIVLIGLPKFQAGVVNTNVRAARTALINMIAAARTASSQTNRSTWGKIESNRALVLARPRRLPGAGNADTIGPVQDLGQAYGVTVRTGTATTVDSFGFNPSLTTLGAVATKFSISHSGRTDTVGVDGIGRVRK